MFYKWWYDTLSFVQTDTRRITLECPWTLDTLPRNLTIDTFRSLVLSAIFQCASGDHKFWQSPFRKIHTLPFWLSRESIECAVLPWRLCKKSFRRFHTWCPLVVREPFCGAFSKTSRLWMFCHIYEPLFHRKLAWHVRSKSEDRKTIYHTGCTSLG